MALRSYLKFAIPTLTILLLSHASAHAQITQPAPKPVTGAASQPHVDSVAKPAAYMTLGMNWVVPTRKVDNASIDSSLQFQGAKRVPDSLLIKEEKHLRNLRQLTFAGENAEAYLSFDGKHVSFQARGNSAESCDQIWKMDLDGTNVKRISNGYGRCTCSYFLPSGDKVLYASTHGFYSALCPPKPDPANGYVWPMYPGYDIYVADTNGNAVTRLTNNDDAYDAEATVSPRGDKIVFTSTRNGDLDLYSMNVDGSDVKQLTNEEGYDGGAFFSPDGKQIVYRAARPAGEELTEYRSLLKQGLYKPHNLEIYIMNADGSNKRQITNLGDANWAPYWHPDGKRIIFATNMKDPKKRNFDLYMINTDGTGLEQITYSPVFDGFPVFTADGKHLIFGSNRFAATPHNTNLFIADWVE